jgi:small subunit ribosomal protein S15
MARMHSRRKGKAGSKKPVKKVKPVWIRYTGKEIEQLVVKLSKSGKTPSEIGVILRDTYGVPDVKTLTKKKICKILDENKAGPKLPSDLIALIKKDIDIMKHVETNKKDMSAKRGLLLTISKIRRLTKYYKNVGKLPRDWIYDRSKAKLLLE